MNIKQRWKVLNSKALVNAQQKQWVGKPTGPETLDKDLFHLQALRLVKKLPNKTFVYRSNLW